MKISPVSKRRSIFRFFNEIDSSYSAWLVQYGVVKGVCECDDLTAICCRSTQKCDRKFVCLFVIATDMETQSTDDCGCLFCVCLNSNNSFAFFCTNISFPLFSSYNFNTIMSLVWIPHQIHVLFISDPTFSAFASRPMRKQSPLIQSDVNNFILAFLSRLVSRLNNALDIQM